MRRLSTSKFFLPILILLPILFFASAPQAASIAFSWMPNSEPNLAGYRLYYGIKSHNFDNFIDVGLPVLEGGAVNCELTNLAPETTYYFAVTAYDANGFESGYSHEIQWRSPPVTGKDFNGDGRADILLRDNTTGTLWLSMIDTEETTSSEIDELPDWSVKGLADFNGDGNADILLRHNAFGNLWLYEMNGNAIIAKKLIDKLNINWSIAGVADFNGDAKADILLRHNIFGNLWLYEMDGNSIYSEKSISGLNLSWTIEGLADFNGDNKADILLRNTTWGTLSIYEMDGSTIVAQHNLGGLSSDWNILGISDCNNNGTATILIRNNIWGGYYLYEINDESITSQDIISGINVSSGWIFTDFSDYNGDGTADILFTDPQANSLKILEMYGNNILNYKNIMFNINSDWQVQ